MDIENLITKNGRLNCNLTRQLTEKDKLKFRTLSNVNTASINTALYCLKHKVPCKTCRHCGKELSIENFVVGWVTNKQYCSVKCKASFDSYNSSGEICTDYSLLLDKTGALSTAKVNRHMNLETIEDLKQLTGIETDNVTMLLHAVMNEGFVPRHCDTCNTLLPFGGMNKPYRDTQKTCSYECKDKNIVYREALSKTKKGISRFSSKNYLNDVAIPWYEDRKVRLLEDNNVLILTTFDEYLDDKLNLRFKCIECNSEFFSNLGCGRSPFCKKCSNGSRQQTEICRFIESLGYNVEFNDRTIIKPKEIDLYIPSMKIGIEYDGFYWHDDRNDIDKYNSTKDVGVRLIKIFEDEYQNKKEIVLSRIKSILGKTENTVYARKCTIVKLTPEQSSKFLEENHIQGNVNASMKYGLIYKGDLVSVMTFSKSRYDKSIQWELIRFASKINYSVVGGASKLLSHFIKENSPDSILSYCDLRYGDGNVYEKLGFVFARQTKPNYFYYKRGKRHSRIEFQKHKLEGILEKFDSLKTETENMSDNGYLKIYDFGNLVYIWKKK